MATVDISTFYNIITILIPKNIQIACWELSGGRANRAIEIGKAGADRPDRHGFTFNAKPKR